MSARRTQSSTIGSGSDITSIGSVDLKIWQKLPQGLKFEIQCSRSSWSVPPSDAVSLKNKLI